VKKKDKTKSRSWQPPNKTSSQVIKRAEVPVTTRGKKKDPKKTKKQEEEEKGNE